MIWTTKKSAGSSRCACRDVITITVVRDMGDCRSLRCAQEKRHFRKELVSWYKKVPYTIGLELVAENLAGNASGHIKTLLLPFNDMEPEETVDFQPDKQSNCIFCEGKPQIDPPEQENNPKLVPSIEPTTPSQSQSSRVELQECNGNSDGLLVSNGTTAASVELPALEGFNSFYNQLAMTSLLYQQQQLQSAAVQAALTAGASSSSSSQRQQHRVMSALGLHQRPDLALDLTSAAASQLPTSQPSSEPPGALRVPEIRTKKRNNNSPKKAYTDRELNAAVEAIKSGNVGTRRAAQIYGVPRSTLRNKVFKSGEMSRQLSGPHGLISGEGPLNDSWDSPPPPKSDSDSQSSSPKSKHISPRGKSSSELPMDSMTQYNEAVMKQLEELKAKQGVSDQLSLLSQQSRLLGEMFNPLQFASTANYPFFMPPQYSALTAMPGLDYINPYASSMMMPYLPELMKNLAQKQLEANHMAQSSGTRPTSSASKAELSSNKSRKRDNDNIKVPAYKPVTSHINIDTGAATGSKATKSSSSKLNKDKLSELPSTYTAANYLHNIISQSPSAAKRAGAAHTSHISHKKSAPDQSQDSSHHTHSSLSNGNSSGKKRPKRGQYRRYDSELLAEAVKSVQRGEMSVHRAGTFFGVPHSTLEYKVKERHLLRKKKMAENKTMAASSPVVSKPSATNTACNNSTDSYQSETKLELVSPKLEVDDSKNAASGSDNNTPSFMDFSSPYNLNTPASELLMKLHARAHQKANEIMNGAKKTQETIETQDSPQISLSN